MSRSRHSALRAEVEAMKVGDCLQLDLPAGYRPHAMSANVSNWSRGKVKGIDSVLRVHHHNRRMFIVRLA